ncbi:MAG: SPOR domain-containing protein [Sideroxydans sp.]|nr:SPOR domain-containing protein [Sideroxydans sp.]
MSKAATKKSSTGSGSPLMVGLLVGLMVGMAIAAGLAWYLMKSPSGFISKPPAPRIAAEPVKALPPAASAVSDGKPRFEFYKVLTDKPDATVGLPNQAAKVVTPAAPTAAIKPAPVVVKTDTAAAKQTYYLQVGAFANADDAEKLKAKLSLQGMDVAVQSVTIPDKGVLNRVRTGPYQGADEMNKARAALKLSGTESTPVRIQ